MDIWWVLCFRYHLGLCTMQKLLDLGKTTLVSICFRMVLTQIINSGIQRFSHLGIPTRYQYQFWYPWVSSLIPLLILSIDTMHATIYRSNIDFDPPFANMWIILLAPLLKSKNFPTTPSDLGTMWTIHRHAKTYQQWWQIYPLYTHARGWSQGLLSFIKMHQKNTCQAQHDFGAIW